MKSNVSSSTPSPESPFRRRRKQGWSMVPELLLLPVLIAVVQTLAATPLLYMFFGEQFGLTGGRPVMWPGGLALLGLAGFWLARFIARVTTDARYYTSAMGFGWLIAAATWIGIEPVYGLRGLLADPGSLVGSHGYLVAPLLLSLFVWWQGFRYATTSFLMTAEEIRGNTQRSWMLLIGSLIFAVFLNNDAGESAIDTTPIVVPSLMIASVALVAAAEIHASRRQISHSGGRPPTWSRWGRLVGGVSAAILAVVVVVTILLTPGAFSAMIGAIVVLSRVIGQLLLWVLYGVFYTLYYAFYAVTELLRAFFDFDVGPMLPPEQPEAMQDGPLQIEQRESAEWQYANLILWGLLGVVVLTVILVLFRFARRRSDDGADAIGDEERSSVFSADLAKSQIRDLLRRRHRSPRIPTLNLDESPGDVRETWRYLQVLAVRQEVGRRESETPRDFAARLRAVWPGTAAALNELARRYERNRYGDLDSERDREAASVAWTDIYQRRRDAEIERDGI